MKVQWNESGGRILLGGNTGGGVDKLRQVRRHYAGAWQGLGLVAQCSGSAHVRAFFMLCLWNITQQISGFLGTIFFAEKKIIRNYVTWSDLLNWLHICDATCVWRIDERVMVGLCLLCYSGPVCIMLWWACVYCVMVDLCVLCYGGPMCIMLWWACAYCVMVVLCVLCYEFVSYTSLVNWSWVGHRKKPRLDFLGKV